MTEEQSKRIAALAADVHDKRLRYQNLGMMNTAGLSAADARAQTVAYQLAHAEYLEALALLESAKLSIVTSA